MVWTWEPKSPMSSAKAASRRISIWPWRGISGWEDSVAFPGWPRSPYLGRQCCYLPDSVWHQRRPAGVCSGDCLQNSDFSTPRNVLAVISPIPRERFFAFSLVLVCPLLNLPGQLMSKPLCVKLGKAEVRLNVQEPGARCDEPVCG